GAIGNIRATQTGVSNLGVYGLSLQFNTSGGGVIGDTDGGTVNISNIVSENNEITSQRYAGGVMFGLRNGSTLTNATVKNVSVSTTSTSGETWSGGVVGYTSGARVILTNAQVDNLSLDCVGAQVGGIVGHIAGSAIITESMIKNSTLCADQRIGGVVYYLRGESSINKTAVVNTSITARNTGANTLVYVGGIAGAVNSSEPKAIQYSYVDGVSIYAVGRRTGGLIGTVENAANNISKNYVKDTSIHCSAIETGSFTGLRLGGNLEDNFVVRCSDVPRVGTATAGQTGDIQGVYGVRVYEGDVTELDTGEAIDYYVSNARFVSSFDDVHAAPLKEMFGSVYEESVSFVAVIHAALSQRLEAQIDVLSEIYNRYDMVCLLNYEDIGAWLPGVKTEIAAAIPLSEGLRAKYDFYLDLVAQFNAFLASNGYNSYYELEVGFSTRVVREDDVARYESPRDDFAVDYEKMRNVVDKVDAMLLGGDFATLAGMDLPLQETVQQALAESLYTNENINSVMSEIYPTIVSEMEEAIEENAEFKVLGISISFRGKARSLLDDLMNQFGLAIYPNNLAAKIDTKYAKVRSVLNAAGKNWNAVNFDNPEASNYLDWGEMDKDAFIDALGNSLRGVYGVIRPLLTSNSFDQTKKADFAANVDVKARIVISAVNSYNRAILPLFEMLDVQGFMPSAEFNALSSVDAMMDNILYPVFNWIENELTTAPFSNLVELLPNIAYCLHFGLVESWLKTIKTSIRYDLDGEVDLLFDDATFGIADKTMQLSIYDSLSEEPDDLLYRADLSSFNGLLQVLLKAADINAELPPINNSNLASLGKLVQKDSATTALTRYYISGDSVKVTHMLLEYLFTIMGDEALFGEILAAIEEDETLDEGLSEVFKAIGKSPKDAIAAIVELCNPVEYPLRKLNYGNPLATTQTKVQYSDLWSREHARHITDNLDGYIDNLLNLFGLPAAGELLRETFGELYTNRTLTSVVTGLRDALTDISSSEKILKILNIDISSWQDVEEGHDWGIADGDKDAFLETLCEALSPLNNAIGLFLADRDYTLMDSQITLKGYNGYRHALVPLLEALGCAQDTLLTGDAYLAAVAEDENSMLKHIVRPIFELLERVYEKPAETLFSILPNLLYFVNSGALDTAILNFAQPILVVIDTLRPIYNLEFDLSARDMLSKAMTDALSDLGFILPEGTLAQLEAYAVAATNLHGEEIYVIEANHEDVLTLLLRYLLNFVFHPSNRDALKALLVEQAGIEGQQKQVLETALDTFASMAQNGKGADGILRGIYYVFYGTGIGGEQVTDFLNDFNANWKKVFEMMANSEVEFIRTLGETARNLLNEYFENIFDEGGLASNGLLQFFRSISEFFKRIAAFFSSLFGT
ncbi:MAG: hypothetical protein LBS36_01450, partial [Oscillospiraceae bacterium]|nr:hypothetical protein [Oscillospiraceae bacterium]